MSGPGAEPALPAYGVVVLTMGRRPDELAAGLASLLAQEGVRLDVVVVGNGWLPTDLPPVIALSGPTAAGKSGFAIAICERLGGRAEIVSVDSAQIYRGMDIGSAKPDAAIRARVPHYLIDILDPA